MSDSIALDLSDTFVRTISSHQPQIPHTLIDSKRTSSSEAPNQTDSITDVSQEDSVSRSSPFCVVLVGFANKLNEIGRHGGSASSSTSSSDPFLCELPWGGKVKCFGYYGETHILLPPFSEVIGFSTSVDALDMSGTRVVRIPYDRKIVRIDGEQLVDVTHIAFRNLQPVELSRCIARRVVMVGGNSTHKQICESGPVINSEGTIAESRQEEEHQTFDVDVIITSPGHRLVEKEELSKGTLHGIPTTYRIDQLDEMLEHINSYTKTLRIKSPCLSVTIFLLSAMLWMLPGFLQWLGNDDRNWASIINQCIGTGSVLLGVITYISRKLFSHDSIRAAAKGMLNIRNDFAAKFFACGWVRNLRTIACHPILPSGLIAKDSNSCVRVRRNGWVRVGKNIPVKEAGQHGYFVLRMKGLVLDLYAAKIYKLLRTKDGNVRILRAEDNQEEWTWHSVPDTARFV